VDAAVINLAVGTALLPRNDKISVFQIGTSHIAHKLCVSTPPQGNTSRITALSSLKTVVLIYLGYLMITQRNSMSHTPIPQQKMLNSTKSCIY
jgi:hypothetical protein